MASWLLVRTLGASPELASQTCLQADTPLPAPASVGTAEIRDAALAQMIGRFAAAARAVAQSDR
jgi:hypothetical protein